MTFASTLAIPAYDIDFYSDEVIAEPYPHYQTMRDLGPVVWLPQHQAYAITRFADVRAALRSASDFLSGKGVMLNDPVNQSAAGTSMLNMDDPQHAERRRILGKPLTPAALKPLQGQIQSLADALVTRLVAKGSFDGVSEFAHFLPLTLVRNLVGLPERGRENMLEWAANIFNVMGTINERFLQAIPSRNAAQAYLDSLDREDLLPDSWAARLFDLVDQRVLTEQQARDGLFDYTAPALDTTINGTSAAIWLLGQHPEQWELLRRDPSLIPAALDEAMRLESPIRAFSRFTANDVTVDGATIPAGSRVLVVYASANRDERRWDEPECFNILRNAPQEQLAFGTGIHMCAGMHLAKLEMRCLFEAFAARVKRFRVFGATRELHNVLRGLARVDVEIVEAT